MHQAPRLHSCRLRIMCQLPGPLPACRRALVDEVRSQLEVAGEAADGASVRARLDGGVEAELRLAACWPASFDVVEVRRIGAGTGHGTGSRQGSCTGPGMDAPHVLQRPRPFPFQGPFHPKESLLPLSWQVVEVTGAADATKAAKSQQLRLEGRSLLQGLEAVGRELA